MKGWCKKLVVLALLVLPLQGFAAALSAFNCYSPNGHQDTIGTHHDGGSVDPHGHHDGKPHGHDGVDGAQHEDGADVEYSGHLNCHQVVTGIPATVAMSTPAELPAFEPSIYLLSTLFVPERPQRPPRL